ncbi:Retrovirus-related Pol polyprotein from transposon TNT 1-94 [Orchesella cincta]|uniref:Retrovirus-related Pol polyprotein from transposon TNT 1-94 n=1 Tax=Orchesella cincta TaxID=48709 RepID=A0A1D2M1D5_ORCCI|nr:Retrovirus-related Pol polyprotein from transposon TNT 1-94 [Orchesella cincta]
MLIAAKAPEFLWAEAVATSLYIHNRILNKHTASLTAYEMVFGKKPHLGHIKTFGCTAYKHVPKQQRGTWDAKSTKCILVGYDSNSNNYRLYDSERGNITIGRNVTFEEEAVEYFLSVSTLTATAKKKMKTAEQDQPM